MSYDEMPQCGFDDIEGADVSYLKPVLLAEQLPAQSNLAVVFVVCTGDYEPDNTWCYLVMS